MVWSDSNQWEMSRNRLSWSGVEWSTGVHCDLMLDLTWPTCYIIYVIYYTECLHSRTFSNATNKHSHCKGLSVYNLTYNYLCLSYVHSSTYLVISYWCVDNDLYFLVNIVFLQPQERFKVHHQLVDWSGWHSDNTGVWTRGT